MPVKTTLLALAAIVAFGASLCIVSNPCFAATEKPRVFERSVHGTYKPSGPKSKRGTDASGASTTNAILFLDQTSHSMPVIGTASASGRGGYWLRRFKARSRAIARWRVEAADRYGPNATRWLLARHKQVACSALADNVICTVSALPSTPWQRLGLARY